MADVQTTNENLSEGQIAQMTDDLKNIFGKKPNESLVKASTLISGPRASTIWNDVSDEPYRYKADEKSEYADAALVSHHGFENLKFENITKLGLLLNRLINEHEEILSAPNGLKRVTNLRIERRGAIGDSDWEIKVTTFGEESSDMAKQRLDKLVSSIEFIDNTGAYISTFDKFANPTED